MGKKEYIKANQDWLEAKAQEEGVMPLPLPELLPPANPDLLLCTLSFPY